jgi:hypothetical protein
LNVCPTGRTPSWCASVVALVLACLPGSFSQVSLDRAPRARVGTIRATACGTQRLERCGADISRIVPDSGVRSAPGSASVCGTRYDAGPAAVVPLAHSVPPVRTLSAIGVPGSFSIPDRPLLTHAGRSPPRS